MRGLGRSHHRPGFMTVPIATTRMIQTKNTSVTMRKNAPRRLGSIQAYLLAARNLVHTDPRHGRNTSGFTLFKILFRIEDDLLDRTVGRNRQKMELAAHRAILHLKGFSMIDRRPNRKLVQHLRVFNAEC